MPVRLEGYTVGLVSLVSVWIGRAFFLFLAALRLEDLERRAERGDRKGMLADFLAAHDAFFSINNTMNHDEEHKTSYGTGRYRVVPGLIFLRCLLVFARMG